LLDEVLNIIYRGICCRDLHLHGFQGPGSKDNISKLLCFIDDPSSLFPIMPGTSPKPAIAMDQGPTMPKQIDYFSFPPEIRNKIMDFALRPAHIHPPYTRSCVQILATNRQHYKIGHVTYYADNIFHMPLGVNYGEFPEKYRFEHRKLVRRVTLTCSILDLIEETATSSPTRKCCSIYAEYDQVPSMTRELKHIWDNRFQAISRIFPYREEISVEFPHFKPSPELLRARAWRHASETPYWPAIERACELESSTLLIRRRERKTCLVRADGSVDAIPGCLTKPWGSCPILYFMMDEAAEAALPVLEVNLQGEGKGQPLWAWLVEQMEEYRTEIRKR